MTPIKEILVIGSSVFYIDHAGQMNFAASSVSDNEALIIAAGLAIHHKMPDAILVLDTVNHAVTKVSLDAASRGRRK